jgi:CheY-like chemotaxis protein
MTPHKTRVLVIDDEPQILRALRINLSVRGYEVLTAATGVEALRTAADHRPDVIVLDLGLPDMSGIEVLGGLRGWLTAPVIVLSARTDSSDKVEALDAGADDYVTKPFGMDEFLARLRAAVRRGAAASDTDEPVIETSSFTVDLAAKKVTKNEPGHVGGQRGGHGDHRDHKQPGEVFDAAESVGVAAGGGAPAQCECDPQRDRGQGVGKVMDGVGQQGDRAGDQHDHQLGDGGGAECEQADLDRADTGDAGFQRAVDAVGGVMAVRCEHLQQRCAKPPAATVVAVTVVVTGGVVLVVGHARSPARGKGAGSVSLRACSVRRSPVSRWCPGMPGPACSALNTASVTSCPTWSFSRL